MEAIQKDAAAGRHMYLACMVHPNPDPQIVQYGAVAHRPASTTHHYSLVRTFSLYTPSPSFLPSSPSLSLKPTYYFPPLACPTVSHFQTPRPIITLSNHYSSRQSLQVSKLPAPQLYLSPTPDSPTLSLPSSQISPGPFGFFSCLLLFSQPSRFYGKGKKKF